MSRPGGDSRRAAVAEIVSSEAVTTQAELRRRLAARGIRVSQSTLSRDIRYLGLVKQSAAGGGLVYALPERRERREARALGRLLPELMVSVEPAGSLVVVKTLTGAAQPVAAALDHSAWPQVVGTVAGDDTVLIVTRSERDAGRVVDGLMQMSAPR